MHRARRLAWGSVVVLAVTGIAYVTVVGLSLAKPHEHPLSSAWSDDNSTHATWQDIPVFRHVAHRATASSVAHKALWPLNVRDVFMIGIAFVSIFVAAGGGIGGGGVLVPLYILVGDFSTRQSVALSNVTILGGALANLVCNINRKHPRANRSLIDWDLILVMEPATIVGALLGGYLNKLLPVWLTTTLLVLLLTAMTFKLVTKGLKTYHIETELQHVDEALLHDAENPNQRHTTANGMVHAAANGGGGLHEPLLLPSGEDEDVAHEQAPSGTAEGDLQSTGGHPSVVAQQDGGSERACTSSDEEELQELLQLESVQVPLMKVAVLVGVSAWVVVSDSLKETVPCGSLRYWGLVLSLLPCIAVVTVEMRRHLLWKGHVKAAAGHLLADEELNWTPVTTLLYPAISTSAGVIAGLFGVGGGIVKGPLMLELGVSPDVAAATAATMIFFTAGAACIIFIHFGGIVWDYATLLLALGFFVTLAGQLATYQLVQKLGRRSPIIFMMGGLMAMATTVMYYQTAATWVDLAHHPDQFAMIGHICPPGHIKGASHLAAALLE